MELETLVNAMHLVELLATTRTSAIRELVNALNWADEGILPGDVVKAIEDREATAHTIVEEGLALPHAIIEWAGDFRIVLGRSQAGVDYIATANFVRTSSKRVMFPTSNSCSSKEPESNRDGNRYRL